MKHYTEIGDIKIAIDFSNARGLSAKDRETIMDAVEGAYEDRLAHIQGAAAVEVVPHDPAEVRAALADVTRALEPYMLAS